VGSPDLVLEVVSDSSVRKDTQLLRAAYLAAEIQEFWLVDARGPQIRFEILHHRGNEYRAMAPSGEPQTSQVLGRRWRLSRTLNRGGRFSYRLEALPSP
jgi:Uma2 family endonuclease